MSAGSRNPTTSGWRAFQRSRPPLTSAFVAARAISMTGHARPAAARRCRARALPLGRQAGVRVARGDRRRTCLRHLGRRAAVHAAARVLAVCPTLPRRLDPRRLALLLRVVGRPRGVALAFRFIAGGQLQQRVKGAGGRIDPGPGIAPRGIDRRHGGQGEVLRHHVGHLVPAQRERDPGVGERPDGVGGGHGPVLRVLVVVQEHAVPLLLPPARGGDRRRPPLHVPRQRQRGAPDLRVRPAPLDPDVRRGSRGNRTSSASRPGRPPPATPARPAPPREPGTRARPAPGRGPPAARRDGPGRRLGRGAG